jgi:hypothetical protein
MTYQDPPQWQQPTQGQLPPQAYQYTQAPGGAPLPGYGPPPGYVPGKPPKKKHHRIRNSLLGGVGLIILIVIIVSIASGGGKSNQTASTNIIAASSSGASNVAAPPASGQPNTAAKTVLTLAGNGTKNSANFTVTQDQWTIAYNYDCTNFGQAGNFAIDINDSKGQLDFTKPGVNEMAIKGNSSTVEHGAGTYSLSIDSECDWNIAVTG